MSRLTKNLKLYNPFENGYLIPYTVLQIIILSIIYFLGTIFEGHQPSGDMNKFQFLPFFLAHVAFSGSMLLFGRMVATIQLDILIKPFSFNLPNQNMTLNRIIFLIGISANLFYGALIFYLFHPAGLIGILYFILLLALGLSSYFISIWISFVIKKENKIYMVLIIYSLIAIIFTPVIWPYYIFPLNSFILYSTFPVVLFSILLIFAIWKMLGSTEFKKIYFSKDNTMSFGLSKANSAIQALETLKLKRLSEKVEKETSFEKLFLLAIKDISYLSRTRSIIGRFYCSMDHYYTLRERFFRTSLLLKITLVTFLILLTGYHFPSGGEGFSPLIRQCLQMSIILHPCLLIVSIFAPVFHNHLFPVGRSEQFQINMISLFIHQIVAIIWFLLLIFLSWIISDNMPSFTLDGFLYTYQPLGISLILWPMVIIPVSDPTIHNFHVPYNWLKAFMFTVILIILGLFSFFTTNSLASSTAITLSILFANGFFIYLLAQHWFDKDIALTI